MQANRRTRLPRSCRIRKASDFNKIKRYGRRIRGDYLTLLFAGCHEGAPRLGLVVSRRVGKAVVRNHWRRRLRQLFRDEILRPENQGRSGDYLFIVRPSGREPSYEQLRQEFVGLKGKLADR